VKIFDGFEEIEILPWYECEDCHTHSHFSSRLSALIFLQRFTSVDMAMISLRRLVREGGYYLGPPIPNNEVLERVAAKLATGELHVIRKPLVFGTGASKPESQEGRPQVQAAQLPPPRREAEAPPAPPPDEPVFSPNVDPVATAQVLTQASQDGKPFCEE